MNPNLPVLAKLSSLVQVFQLGGRYELVEKLRSQFVPAVGLMSIEVAWTHDEVVVFSVEITELLRVASNFSSLLCFKSIIFYGIMTRNFYCAVC